MDSSQFFFLLLPLAIIIVVLVVVVLLISKRTEENDYEKEMKELRQALLKGKIDRKTFLYISDNLKAEDHFESESKKLDDMLDQQIICPDNYIRRKKALQLT